MQLGQRNLPIKVTNNLLVGMRGKIRYQAFFERLYAIAVQGMNYSIGGGVSDSGEQYVLQYILNSASKRIRNTYNKSIIFDVGANQGEYTQLLSEAFAEEEFKVHAFEPSPSTYIHLKENQGANSRAELYNFGLGAKAERLPFYTCNENPYLNSFHDRVLEHHGLKMECEHSIELKTIDGFCTENSIENILLLKIDVEGHELEVLKGAEKMIRAQNIQFIQFEFGGCFIDSRVFFRDIFSNLSQRYKIYRVLKDGLRLLERYDESYELFMTANFLAELK